MKSPRQRRTLHNQTEHRMANQCDAQLTSPSADVEDYVLTVLRIFSAVDLDSSQQAEALVVLRSLPPEKATIESFVEGCKDRPSLAPLAFSLKERLATPSRLFSDPKDQIDLNINGGANLANHDFRLNPFHAADTDEILKRIVAMMPDAPEMTPEQQAAFEQQRREGEARYQEARFGALPADTYRILDQGGFLGLHYELEIDGETIVLKEPGESFPNSIVVHSNPALAYQLARAEVSRRHGDDAATRAQFLVVWGGTL